MKLKNIFIFVMVMLVLAGCGETIRGVGRDASRVWYGTKTIFGAK